VILRNTSIGMWFARIFDAKVGETPTEVLPYITPTIELIPKANITSTVSRTATGSSTIYTTPSDKDFYLTNINLGMIKDVACDVATGTVTVTAVIDGVSKSILGLPVISLTAQQINDNIDLQRVPLKIDRGTNISMSSTYTVGVMVRTCTINGYTVETTKGQ